MTILTLVLQIVGLAETAAPGVIALIKSIWGSGKTVSQYLAEAQTTNLATIVAADAQIALDKQKLGQK